MLISVNIPAYNVENYIEECFLSLSRQTENRFEVIIVDDGSNDRTADICRRWVKTYPNWTYIYQKNAGQYAARRRALLEDKGDYAVFLDADDFFTADFIETLCKKILQYNKPSLLCFGMVSLMGDKRKKIPTAWCEEKLLENEKTYNCLKESLVSDSFNSMCQKAVRLPLPDASSTFNENILSMRVGEDALQSIEIIKNARTIVLLNYFPYFYRDNQLSVTRHFDEETLREHIFSTGYMLRYKYDLLSKHFPLEKQRFKGYVERYIRLYSRLVFQNIGWFSKRKTLYEEINASFPNLLDCKASGDVKFLRTKRFLMFDLLLCMRNVLKKTIFFWR